MIKSIEEQLEKDVLELLGPDFKELEEALNVPLGERDIWWMDDVKEYSRQLQIHSIMWGAEHGTNIFGECVLPLFLRASDEMDRFHDYLQKEAPLFACVLEDKIVKYLHNMEGRIVYASNLYNKCKGKAAG